MVSSLFPHCFHGKKPSLDTDVDAVRRSCELESGSGAATAFRSQTEEEELTMRPMTLGCRRKAWYKLYGI